MYESPIRMIESASNHVVEKIENELLVTVTRTVGFDVDKEELLKALKYDRDQYNKGYQEGQWEIFHLIESRINGKQYYSKQENGTVYSRESCTYLRSVDEAIMEFLEGWDY